MNLNLENTSQQENKLYLFLLITGIIVIAFNLRPAITSVGPLLGLIRDDVGLSNWSAGLVTSLPLIAFAIMSPIAPKLGNRLSFERTMLYGLIILLIGISIRSISNIFLLFAGTILVGVGIAVLNVLLPGLIKDKFPLKVGLMTSVYSTSMGIFAASASGLSVPLASGLNLGWQLALLTWIIPVIIGIIIWIFLSNKNEIHNQTNVKYIGTSGKGMWQSPLAWQIACFMGLQSFIFYVTISWLPEILYSRGVSLETAGWMLAFTQFIGLPINFLIPILAGKMVSQRGIAIAMPLFTFLGYSGLLLSDSYALMIIGIILIGFGLAGTFSLALAFLAIRAKNPVHAAELSGMAQSLGYLFAAVGPIFIGYLFDFTASWTAPLIAIIIISIFIMLFGLGAGRNKYVLD
ncbi:CynX/NimT family MFS transporter [Oceanobacillus chungangensis]|uniref:MFS transporter n=1 Tax=Oceanobacillus chungangensis TaxID=1229152 RepID=A0A3D8PH66_9BACI|nr:MFS transporter [Oceanobacillus chungangensis]RDW15426.1 MFS transporter [Oceanobacillus chungangensis]